jgi:hypothetical protein
MTIVAITSAQIEKMVTDAIPKTFSTHPVGTFSTVNTLDSQLIQGEMISVEYTEAHSDVILSSMTVEEFRSVVKKKLVELLIEKILEKNCIEFTSKTDVYNDLTHYRARMYVTPDTQVRVIRKIIKESN